MNNKIYEARTKANLKQWQVAEIIGMREDLFSKKLRHELPQEEQERIVSLIEKYAQEQTDEA